MVEPPSGRLWDRLTDLRLGRAIALVWRSAPRWTVASLVLVVLQGGLPLAGLYLTKLIVDAVGTAVSGGAGGPGGLGHVLVLLGLLAGVGLMGAVLSAAAAMTREAQGHLVTDHVLDLMHGQSVAMDLSYYESSLFHDTLHRAQREAPFRPPRIVDSLTILLQSGITLAGVVALLASVHPLVPVGLAVGVLPLFFVRVRHAGRVHRWQRRRAATERKTDYVSWLLVDPLHARELRSFELGPLLRERLARLRDKLREERIELGRARFVRTVAAQVGPVVAVFGTCAFIAARTLGGATTVGAFVMYLGAVQRGDSLLKGIFTALSNLYEDNLFLSSLDEFLDMEPQIGAPERPTAVPQRITQGFAVEGVSFRYPGSERDMLRDVSLRARPGEMVALVGANGSGKTTLLKLLCRFYDPTDGRITLDGTDLREFDPLELRRRMSVVHQNFAQYQLSARDNIQFGDVHGPADQERVERAAALAGADRLIRGLPSGYQSMLGVLFEGGEELSLGEWQKLALARAFMRDDVVAVLVDEPTSSLDAQAETEIFSVLRDIVRDRAVIVVSHRYSTVRMADRIYMLADGTVVEEGTHRELLWAGGPYAALFRSQMEASIEDGPGGARSPGREAAG